MERIKENAGVIALGVAAASIAGLLLYKTYSAQKGETETPEEELIPDRFFFMDPKLSIDQKNEKITEWVK